MDPKKLQTVQNLAITTLFILMVFSGGFVWAEFKRVSKLDMPDQEKLASVEQAQYITGETAIGKSLYQEKCKRCHFVDRNFTGPALMNAKDRWSDTTKLYSWIKNSQQFIGTGDVYANNLYRKYNAQMPAFPELSDVEIREILYYVDPD